MKRKVNCDHCQVLKEFGSLFVRDTFIQLRIDDAPKSSFLSRPLRMLTVQEGNVEHLFRIVASMVTHIVTLEVVMQDVAVFFQLFNVDCRLGHCGPPAVVSQLDCVTKALDCSLEDFELDLVNFELLLKLSDELLDLRVGYIAAWTHILTSFAQVPPKQSRYVSTKQSCVSRLISYILDHLVFVS